MSRVKRGLSHLKKRRNLLKRVKGFEGGQKNLIKRAKTAELKAGANAYRDRRVKKRDFRGLWQVRINAAVREHGMSYSVFMNVLKKKGIRLDRKVLSTLAKDHPIIFKEIVAAVK